MTLKEHIESLTDGQSYIVPEGDYGKAEVFLKNETYLLFSIPMYGGTPVIEQTFRKSQIDAMINIIENYT